MKPYLTIVSASRIWMNLYLNWSLYCAVREKILWLCTCTAIEIMTAAGVTAYLVYLGQTTVALISALVFAKVIVFHFAIEIHERLKRGRSLLNVSH
jgi:hypothetical protein